MILVPRIGGRNEVRIGVGTSLLVLVALEASLLGSGRMLQIGPLTVKMWLFVAAQLYVIFRLLTNVRLKLVTVAIIMSFIVLLCFGATIGLLQHSTLELIGEDIKPLLYCLMLVFVEMTVRTVKNVLVVVRIIEFASVLMSVAYVAVLAFLFLGVLSFATLYVWLALSSQEFFFRGDTGMFFYKGALYIGIGLIFFAFERSRFAKLALVLAIIGIVATGTRGFFVGLAAVVAVHAVTGKGGLVPRLRYLVVPCAGAVLLLILLSGSAIGKGDSDTIRTASVNQVVDQITPLSIIFGHGLGVGVPLRPVHMEISYLEIFHKQGLLGLTWWASIFFLLLMRYRRARRINYLYAQPLFLSACFVAFESFTNPFINNPIGIFVCIFALVGLDVVSKSSLSAKLLRHRDCAAF